MRWFRLDSGAKRDVVYVDANATWSIWFTTKLGGHITRDIDYSSFANVGSQCTCGSLQTGIGWSRMETSRSWCLTSASSGVSWTTRSVTPEPRLAASSARGSELGSRSAKRTVFPRSRRSASKACWPASRCSTTRHSRRSMGTAGIDRVSGRRHNEASLRDKGPRRRTEG